MTSQNGQWQQVLREGRFAVAAECVPPAGADAEAVRRAAATLRGQVDAVGVVDNRLEIRMSAVATGAILKHEGLVPIVHVTTRDRNRIALLSDILGAQALGVRDFLCTSGDHQTLGREAAARNVFDLDSVQLLSVLDRLRRDGVLFGNGRTVGPCELCLGATANPLGDPAELQALRVAKKVRAGADFVVTQPVFDAEVLVKWLASLKPLGVAGKTAILAGVLVPPSAAKARELNEKVPGVRIPEEVIARLDAVAPEKQRAEAIAFAAALIERLRQVEGVGGVYLMTEGDNAATVEVIEQAGLRATQPVTL